MHLLLTLGLVSLTALLAAADKDEKADLQQPMVNITLRAKGRSAEPEMALDRRPNIRVDTTLVSIPVAVTDPLSRFVTGLEKENFRLYEDKVEQQIIQFSGEDTPVSVGVVFDTSGSMGAKLSRSRQAVSQFLKTENPEDEFFLIEFNDPSGTGGRVYFESGGTSESAGVYASEGEHCTSGRPLHGDEPNEEGPQPPQGDPDHLRWR